MYFGKLIRYLEQRGFGFLALDNASDADEPTFVHISEFQRAGVDFPRVGDMFEFEIAERADGKLRAVNLRVVDDTDQDSEWEGRSDTWCSGELALESA
ncbi:MAG: cold shock domain-containing protein [Rhizobiales bacterium]|nr:cold shock domain-containing protein [Hyphomicrobiales bacterium]